MNAEKIFESFPLLSSTNLQFKQIEENHLDGLFAIYDNDKVFEYCGIIPKHNIQTVQKMIGHFERDFTKRSRVKWGIFFKAQPSTLVGIIEAMDFNHKVNMVTIGYYLAEDYWHKGIATEAVQTINKFLFEEADINRIQAEVMPMNDASKKVLLKSGFIKEGLVRQASFWSGKGIIDLEIYSILQEDYKTNCKAD